MHLCGGGAGGGRESDEHEVSEREALRRSRGEGDRRGRRRRRHGGTGVDTATRTGGGGGVGGEEPGGPRASSPETSLDADADGEHSSDRSGAPGSGGGRPGASTWRSVSPKRRRVGTGIGKSGRPRGDALLEEMEEQSGSLAHSEASGSAGTGGSAHEEEEEEEEEEEPGRREASPNDAETRARGSDGGGGNGSGAGDPGAGNEALTPLEWKAKVGRQPIFMSRGLPEEDAGLLPSHSEGGTPETRSPGRSGVRALSRPAQDPEDDRDRASSCSSADAPVRSSGRSAGGGIVRPGSRASLARVGGGVKGSGGDDGGRGALSPPAEGASARSSTSPTVAAISGLPVRPPNSPGGVVPWHHTSVYEANNPTEDRHAELSHDALGVKVYCVCDGHGGSRAAQFVCDHLAADVLARMGSIAAAAVAGVPAREFDRAGGGGGGSGADNGEGKGDSSSSGGGDGWMGNETEIRRSLADAFTSCDEKFIAQLDPTKNRGYINAGCCVVLALLVRSTLYVAHVGDCRVVLGTTDAARFPPDLLATTAGAPSTPTGSGAAATTAAGRRDGSRQNAGTGGSGGKGRGSKSVGEAATAGARRVTSPLRAAAAAAADSDLQAVALSRDHNCEDADEVALVRARSGDENAIRVSRNDEWKGARAIKRVAGSLAVTRAVGDAYLKKAVFSFSPYKEGVPYITAEPVVTTVELTSNDRFLVLATDGVWEQVSNEEAVYCVSRALRSGSTSRPQRSMANRNASSGGGAGGAGAATSDALVDFVLARSAQSHGMSVPALRALPRGSSRRMLHDDVCATVVHLTPGPAHRAHL
ncbi:unnamed protein product [Scytosiphon promiscuus]